ncbi:MAG: hypothetical protein ABR616_18780 [Dermatophilaceae bacterium]|nr:hypothetical protein [Intrasporangiaceae bacterium]
MNEQRRRQDLIRAMFAASPDSAYYERLYMTSARFKAHVVYLAGSVVPATLGGFAQEAEEDSRDLLAMQQAMNNAYAKMVIKAEEISGLPRLDFSDFPKLDFENFQTHEEEDS